MNHKTIELVDLSKLCLVKSGRTVKLFLDGHPLQIKTSKLYSPFGVKVYTNNYSQYTDCSVSVSCNDVNSMKYYEALDNRIQELITENLEYFNTKEPIEEVKLAHLFRPNKDWPKLAKINIPRDRNGNLESVLFDQEKNKIRINDFNIETVMAKQKTFSGIIECTKVWFYNGGFGTTWNLKQARFFDQQKPAVDGRDTPESQEPHIYSQCMIDI